MESITIAWASFSISRSSTKWSVRHDFWKIWMRWIATPLFNQRNFNVAQLSDQFQFFSQTPAINRATSSSKTFDRIWRGVQANMADFFCNFHWLFEYRDRDVGVIVRVLWIPIWVNNELGNFGFCRINNFFRIFVIFHIIVVFEIKIGSMCFFDFYLFFVLQTMGRKQNVSWSYCKGIRKTSFIFTDHRIRIFTQISATLELLFVEKRTGPRIFSSFNLKSSRNQTSCVSFRWTWTNFSRTSSLGWNKKNQKK